MAPPRVTNSLEVVPPALLAALEIWVLTDVLSVTDPGWRVGLGVLWAGNVALVVISMFFRKRWARWIGLVALGSTYVTSHALVLGVDLLSALAFVCLLIAQVELRILAERFAPLFAATMGAAERSKVARTFGRALVRLGIVLVFAIVVPLVAVDLSVSLFLPATTVPSAFLLAAALVAVVVLLALFPSIEPRAPEFVPRAERRKDI